MNKAIWESSIGKLSFAIFQVSKTTYDEATTIFCSESVFRYYICPLEDDSIFPPALMSNRMMKIELDFGFILRFYQKDSLYRRELERNFEATLDKFGGLSARKALLIRFKSNSPEALGLMSDNFVPRLKALIGFRTVTVDVGPNPHSAIEKHYRERYQQIAQVIRDELAPKMGPAITSHSGLSTYLEFHPLEHIRANLSARAEAIWSKINMVGSGAD